MLLTRCRDIKDVAWLYAGASVIDFLGDDLWDRFKQNGLAINIGLYRRRGGQCACHNEVDLANLIKHQFERPNAVTYTIVGLSFELEVALSRIKKRE